MLDQFLPRCGLKRLHIAPDQSRHTTPLPRFRGGRRGAFTHTPRERTGKLVLLTPNAPRCGLIGGPGLRATSSCSGPNAVRNLGIGRGGDECLESASCGEGVRLLGWGDDWLCGGSWWSRESGVEGMRSPLRCWCKSGD